MTSAFARFFLQNQADPAGTDGTNLYKITPVCKIWECIFFYDCHSVLALSDTAAHSCPHKLSQRGMYLIIDLKRISWMEAGRRKHPGVTSFR